MKKLTAVFLCGLFIILCSCKQNVTEETTVPQEQTTLPEEITTVESLGLTEEVDPAKVLTVYFSHNDPVESAAAYISEKTQAGLYKIETMGEYPDDEAELIRKAQEEYNKNFRPALVNAPLSLREYDIVFLCFPAWNKTMPMALWTFLEDYDLRGKAILPVIFGTEAELNNALRDIQSLKPSLMLADGYCFTGDILNEAEAVDSWINESLYG